MNFNVLILLQLYQINKHYKLKTTMDFQKCFSLKHNLYEI